MTPTLQSKSAGELQTERCQVKAVLELEKVRCIISLILDLLITTNIQSKSTARISELQRAVEASTTQLNSAKRTMNMLNKEMDLANQAKILAEQGKVLMCSFFINGVAETYFLGPSDGSDLRVEKVGLRSDRYRAQVRDTGQDGSATS